MEEVKSALHSMKRKKAGADDGLVADMLETNHEGLLEVMANLFRDFAQERRDAQRMENSSHDNLA